MRLIDTHCHLDLPAFDIDRQEVLERARAVGVTDLVLPAVSRGRWDDLIAYCNPDPGLHYALGIHPLYVDRHSDADLVKLESLIGGHHPVAVGEVGLDYYVSTPDRLVQEHFFSAQLELAKKFQLPVILHVRKAHDQAQKYLREAGVKPGIVHAFSGSLQQAKNYIDLGFRLGFGGTLTYTRSSRIRRLARELPLDSLVLETDAPDMAVSRYRGERNSPEYLPYILAALAETRREDENKLAAATSANARSVLAPLQASDNSHPPELSG